MSRPDGHKFCVYLFVSDLQYLLAVFVQRQASRFLSYDIDVTSNWPAHQAIKA